MANVVFVWHMHQPYYVNPTTKVAMMPWVRLHAVKGYLDMISVIADFPGVHVNFNLTPVLMLQIKELVDGTIKDLWLEWSRRPATELEENEKLALLEHFFKIHHDNMLRPFPRYAELLAKRGPIFKREEARRELRHWTADDLRDLQTWLNLGWCGFTAERLYPELAALKAKGKYFTEEEKQRVLDIHLEILASIPGRYAEAEQRGQVELTTTPFFHPILPLVYDTEFAERCMPGRARPQRFSWPQDAKAQLQLAVDQHTQMFGRAPRGLWPSEGSVAPELVPLMQAVGLKYFCTDEENLLQSLRRSPEFYGREPDHLEVFQGWRVEHEGASINAIFREKPLSDFIGFMAARNEAEHAAQHLITHLRHIADHVPSDTGLIPIVLDGENAWETFRDGGEGFLRALYGAMERNTDKLTSCTVEDYFQRNPPQRTIHTLHSSSWIMNNFDIWIGEDEENRAWELLGETRTFLEHKRESGTLAPAQENLALREVYAAEGSDWFWWYGSDFSTDNDGLFDELFRQHLKNVYAICGEMPPPALDRPIIGTIIPTIYQPPRRTLTPKVDGSAGPFFEWANAGCYVGGTENGAMFRGERLLRTLRFGCDQERLYLRLELKKWEQLGVAVVFRQPASFSLQSGAVTPGAKGQLTLEAKGKRAKKLGVYAAGEVVEIGVPLADLGVDVSHPLQFQVKVYQDGIEKECYPESTPIELAAPGADEALVNWVV